MTILTVEGIVENGRIRLPEDVELPEQTRVYVVIPTLDRPSQARVWSPRLVNPEHAAYFAKKVTEVPADAEL